MLRNKNVCPAFCKYGADGLKSCVINSIKHFHYKLLVFLRKQHQSRFKRIINTNINAKILSEYTNKHKMEKSRRPPEQTVLGDGKCQCFSEAFKIPSNVIINIVKKDKFEEKYIFDDIV